MFCCCCCLAGQDCCSDDGEQGNDGVGRGHRQGHGGLAALDRPLTERRGRSLIAELASTKRDLTAATDEIASTKDDLTSTAERLAATEAAFAAYRADTAALLAALTERLETVEGLTLDTDTHTRRTNPSLHCVTS